MTTCHRRNFDQRSVAIFSLVVLLTGGLLYISNTFWIDNRQNEFKLNFIPANFDYCEDLLQNSSVYGIEMSQMYRFKKKAFEEAIRYIRNVTVKGAYEGHSGQVIGQYLIMHHLAGQSAARRICETGFNFGHSSFNYLTANEEAIVHSFDLGNHGYAHKMSEFMKKHFPTRFFIHFGDSTNTIPEFIRSNPDFRCDLIFVDGGHTYTVAIADLVNFAKISNLKENIILFDDYPTDWGKDFGKAWDDVVKKGIVKEHMRCTFQNMDFKQRGFSIGRVMKKEDDISTLNP